MNVLILAAESGETADPLQLILPATAELVYGFIAFAVVAFLMAKYAFPRLGEVLDERRESIQGQMEAAEQARQEAADGDGRKKEGYVPFPVRSLQLFAHGCTLAGISGSVAGSCRSGNQLAGPSFGKCPGLPVV